MVFSNRRTSSSMLDDFFIYVSAGIKTMDVNSRISANQRQQSISGRCCPEARWVEVFHGVHICGVYLVRNSSELQPWSLSCTPPVLLHPGSGWRWFPGPVPFAPLPHRCLRSTSPCNQPRHMLLDSTSPGEDHRKKINGRFVSAG